MAAENNLQGLSGWQDQDDVCEYYIWPGMAFISPRPLHFCTLGAYIMFFLLFSSAIAFSVNPDKKVTHSYAERPQYCLIIIKSY